MAEELRALHDRMGATTVYVTHDQLEAMQMGDKIVVMNHGVVEQWSARRRRSTTARATMFVADFIGSPPMNFLRFEADLPAGRRERAPVGGWRCGSRRRCEGASGRRWRSASGPSMCASATSGALRGEVLAAEYLGTTQIVTLRTTGGRAEGAGVVDLAVRDGETVGLAFDTAALCAVRRRHRAGHGPRPRRGAPGGNAEGGRWLR